jgi:hypothetical protein
VAVVEAPKMRSLWEDVVHSRAFWVSYICAGVDFGGCPSLLADEQSLVHEPIRSLALRFTFPAHYHLLLTTSGGVHDLKLIHPLERAFPVGRMDSHQMSDLFRWDEFQAVTRYLASVGGPAWAYELLLSFYIAVTRDCAEQHLALLHRCLDASSVFSREEVEHIIAYTRRVAVRHDFRWRADPELGWVAEGKDSYCMRSVGGLDLEALYASMCASGNDPALVQAILGLPDSRDGFNFAAFRDFLRVVEGT